MRARRCWLGLALVPGSLALALAGPAPRPTPAPAPAPAPAARAALEVRFVSLNGRGIELLPARVRLRAAEPAVRACIDPKAPVYGALRVSVRFARQAIAAIEVIGPAASGTADCVAAAVRAAGLEPQGGARADLSAVAVVRAQHDESALPELRDGEEELSVLDDATCVGVTSYPCAPNKACMAPTSRAVRCPAQASVPERQPLGDRRLVLGLSGGKPGQLGERIILADGGAQCVLVVMTDVGASPPDDGRAESREDSDLPCARARPVLALASRLGLSKLRKPKAESHPDEVTHTWELWRPAKGPAPILVTGTWSGRSPKADAIFAQLAQALGALARDYSTLQPTRMAP